MRGRPIIVTQAPAAGADIAITVPANKRWSLRAFGGRFVSSAVVANRNVFVEIDNGAGLILFIVGQVFTVPASTNTRFYTGPGCFYDMPTANPVGVNVGGGIGVAQPMKVFPQLDLVAGWRITTATLAIDAGDQWSQVVCLVEEWDV